MRIKNVVICDDIRQENNGKFILIGVYQENVLFAQFPSIVNLATWTEVKFDRNGEVLLEIRVLQNRKTLVFGKMEVQVADYSRPVALTVPPVHLRIDENCILSFQIREIGGKWHTLKKLPMELHKE